MKLFYYIAFLLLMVSGVQSAEEILYGEITDITLDQSETLPNGDTQRQQLLNIKLSTGEQVEVLHEIPDNLLFKLIFKEGDSVILHQDQNTEGIYFIDGYRIDYIAYVLIGIFIVLVLTIGGKKGLFALLSLIVQGGLLIYFLIPALKAGWPPLLIASVFCALATLLTMLLVSGWNYKTISASIGTIGGVIFAGVLGIWAVYGSHLTGLLEQETQSLHFQFPEIVLPELIAAGVIIGALGATMDVAMSIASSVHEINEVAPNQSFKALYNSGMNIGKDIMGTMVNTLILAYIGSAITVIILLSMLDIRFLLNTELLMREIILAFVGSIGLILTIPITALCSGFLYTLKK